MRGGGASGRGQGIGASANVPVEGSSGAPRFETREKKAAVDAVYAVRRAVVPAVMDGRAGPLEGSPRLAGTLMSTMASPMRVSRASKPSMVCKFFFCLITVLLATTVL